MCMANASDTCGSANSKDHAVCGSSRCGCFLKTVAVHPTHFTPPNCLMIFSLGRLLRIISPRNAPLKVRSLCFLLALFHILLSFQGRCENPAKGRERAAWLGQVICSRSHLIPRMEGGNRHSRRVDTWNGQDRERGSFSILPKLNLRMDSLLALKCCEFPGQAIYPH